VPAESKTSKKWTAPVSTFAGLGISIAIHLALFLLVGSFVIFEGKVPAVPFLGGVEEVGGGLDMEEEMPLLEEEPIQMETAVSEDSLMAPTESMAETTMSSMEVISAATTSSAFTLPTGVAGPSISTDSLTGSMRGSLQGKGPGVGKGITGNLFGRSITATSLGVILDISGSAHSHLEQALNEIDKSFPSANMILVVGCGMSDGTKALNGGGGKVPGKPRIVPYNDRGSNDKFDNLERSVPGQLQKFFSRYRGDKREEMEKYFKRRDNLYMLYGGDIHGTNFAFDYLLDLNADVIYWFADFADTIDKKIIEDLTKDLRRNSVKVIAHNFQGKNVRAEAREMAEKTGGSTIEVVPGSKK